MFGDSVWFLLYPHYHDRNVCGEYTAVGLHSKSCGDEGTTIRSMVVNEEDFNIKEMGGELVNWLIAVQ